MKFIKLLSLISIIMCVLPLCGHEDGGADDHNRGRVGHPEHGKKRKRDDNTAQQGKKRLKSRDPTKPDIRIVAYLGYENRVRELAIQDPNLVNEPDLYWRTALHYAAQRGHKDIVEFLLKQGAEFYVKDREGITPYKLADLGYRYRVTKIGKLADNLAAVKSILRGKTLQYVYKNITISPRGFKRDVYTDPNAKNSYGKTLLHIACMDDNPNTDNTKLITMLLEVEAHVDVRDDENQTPLRFAIGKGQEEKVEILLELGADVNQPDFKGVTPLHIAAVSKCLDVLMSMLKQKNVKINKRDADGKTPLHWAVTSKGGDNKEKEAKVAMLLIRGADANARDRQGKTLLHWATTRPISNMKMLLDRGANVNAEDYNAGQTPLHWVVANKGGDNKEKEAKVAILLERGADANARDNKGKTPYYYAVTSHAPECVRERLRIAPGKK